ncbi:MAG: hypothetical protein ABL931_10785 [Usitatibacteraceae bacterium]
MVTTMKDLFDPQPGWATPIAPRFGRSFLAGLMGWFCGTDECLAQRQGRCPGKEQCHDCQWSEGTPRDGRA